LIRDNQREKEGKRKRGERKKEKRIEREEGI